MMSAERHNKQKKVTSPDDAGIETAAETLEEREDAINATRTTTGAQNAVPE